MLNLDRRLAACGITTFCHAISFADNELGLRSPKEAEILVRMIRRFVESGRATIRHKIHARYEMGSIHSASLLESLIDDQILDVVSFMDHTPGQGQFKTLQSYIDYFRSTYKMTSDEIIESVDKRKLKQVDGLNAAAKLAAKALAAGIPLLSHDDDRPEKIEAMKRWGITASEFPVTMEAVKTAKENNFMVFMGAPNLMRDRSTNSHIKASDTLQNGTCDGLISDYYPECLIQAPFIAYRRYSIELDDALKLVTTQPSRFLKSHGFQGMLGPDRMADIIVINTEDPWVSVSQTWVGGKCVYQIA
jgi:alpha-D-ribose 1-methylphosphonate 5-triphosphate diphosphatase